MNIENISATNQDYDWYVYYNPSQEGQPTYESDLDWIFSYNYPIKNSDITVNFVASSAWIYKSSYGAGLDGGEGNVANMTETLPDGTSVYSAMVDGENQFRFKTNVAENKLEYYVNGNYHGYENLDEIWEDKHTTVHFYFHKFSITSFHIEVQDVKLYYSEDKIETKIQPVGQSGNIVYPQPLVFEGQLLDENENVLPNKTLNFYRGDTFITSATTDDEGKIRVEDVPEPSTGLRYNVYFDEDETYESSSYTFRVIYRKGELGLSFTEETKYVGQTFDSIVTVNNVHDIHKNGLVVNYEYKPYDKKGQLISSKKKTGILSRNSDNDFYYTVGGENVYSADLVCSVEGTVYYEGITSTKNYTFLPKLDSSFKTISNPNVIETRTTGKIVVELFADNNKLVGKTVHVDVTGIREDGTEYVLSSNVAHQTKNTNSDGQATVSFGTNVAGTYTFVFSYDGEESINPTEYTTTLKFTKIETAWRLIEKSSTPEMFEEGYVIFQLYNKKTDTVLSNVNVKPSLVLQTFDGETVTDENALYDTTPTDDEGKIKISYTPTTYSGIIGTFKAQLYENNSYKASSITDTITWEKLTPEWVIVKNYGDTEVTLKGSVVAKLINSKTNTPIANQEVKGKIEFKLSNGNDSDIPDYTVTKTTNSKGEVNLWYEQKTKGDIIGKFFFILEENELYSEAIDKTQYLRWNKIKTKITTKPVTHYSGKYTNITEEEPDWTQPSPGSDKNYTNFWAKLEATETETEYTTISSQTLQFINTANAVAFTGTTDENGECNARWTRNSSIVNTSNYTVKFEGNDLFEMTTEKLVLKTLPRVQTTLTERTFTNYPPGFRYNVPFLFGGLLKEGDTVLVGMPVTIKLADIKTWNVTTLSTGVGRVTNYVPKFVGTYEVTVDFNKEGLIDKYIPSTLTYTITIEKETLTLTITPGTQKYTSCGDALINFLLVDSLERPMANKKILIDYDDGTYSQPTWQQLSDTSITTDNEGKSSYTLQAYSGIRLLRGIFEETEYYHVAETVQKIVYEITRTYTANVTEGIAEIPVECALNSSKGLPNGLYDVHIEYIPPETETGQCELYGISTNTQPIRKKHGTKLVNKTETLESEAHIPLFITTELSNYKNEYLENFEEISKVNNKDISNPPHKTSNLGLVTRGAVGTINNEKLEYYFESEQTREYAGNILEVQGNTTKMQPTLEVTPTQIIGYSEVEMTLKATLYHTYKKYDKFGYEIKKDTNGYEVYYDGITDTYYKIQQGNKVTCTKQDYNNATSIITKTLLSNRTVIWRDSNGVTELVRATTDKNGVATATYGRKTTGTATIYATTQEEENYLPCTTPLTIQTLARITPIFEDIDFTNNHTIYKHSTKLYTYLYIDKNKTPFANQKVIFKQSNTTIGTVTTDSKGYAEKTITATSATSLPYQVVFEKYNQYNSATKNYTIPVDKQDPIITLVLDNTDLMVGDKIKIKATFTEDEITQGPLIRTNLLFQDNNQSIQWQRTDDNGIAEIEYTLKHAGTTTFTVKYDGTNNTRYGSAEATQTITVRKIPTHFESAEGNNIEIYGLTSKDLLLTLKDKNNQTLMEKNVKIEYNGGTINTTTNVSGEITVKTGKYDIGEEKIAKFTFAGDDNYDSTEYTINLKWGNYLNDEQCDDLAKFDTILESWYASDGTSKYGLDVDGLNTRDCNKNIIYECDCSPINNYAYKNVLLRTVCNDLKTEGGYEQTSEGTAVYAPTGVILRNKHIVSSRNCIISFDICFAYNNVNSHIDERQYGGHFGLMSSDDNITTAEKAPLRFEVYRNNAYGIQGGGTAQGSSMAYSFQPNTWYSVDFEINGGNVKMIMYDKNGNTKGYETFKSTKTFEGLNPYVFAYTNGTRFILRRLKVTRQ